MKTRPVLKSLHDCCKKLFLTTKNIKQQKKSLGQNIQIFVLVKESLLAPLAREKLTLTKNIQTI
jgi:hypothetical protein